MNLGRYQDMQADVLQDRIQCVEHSICDTTSPLSAALAAASAAASNPAPAAATGKADGPKLVGNMAAGPVQHPCKPAAGMSQGQAVQDLQSSPGCGVHTTHDHTNTSLVTATACASVPAASCEAGSRDRGQVASEGAGMLTTSHDTAAARLRCARNTAGAGLRFVTWDDVVLAAHSSRFGVVVQEDTLLRCLLGEAS